MPYTFECIVCGVQKKETNHWWTAKKRLDGSLVLSPFKYDADPSKLDDFCICGLECMMKIVTQWQNEIIESSRMKLTVPVQS